MATGSADAGRLRFGRSMNQGYRKVMGAVAGVWSAALVDTRAGSDREKRVADDHAIVGPRDRDGRALQEMPLALPQGQHDRPASPAPKPDAPAHGEHDPAPDQQRRRHRAVLLRRGLGPAQMPQAADRPRGPSLQRKR